MNPIYLGDGAYACQERGMIKIWCERDGVTHAVYLEPEVFSALVRYGSKYLGQWELPAKTTSSGSTISLLVDI